MQCLRPSKMQKGTKLTKGSCPEHIFGIGGLPVHFPKWLHLGCQWPCAPTEKRNHSSAEQTPTHWAGLAHPRGSRTADMACNPVQTPVKATICYPAQTWSRTPHAREPRAGSRASSQNDYTGPLHSPLSATKHQGPKPTFQTWNFKNLGFSKMRFQSMHT